MESRTRIYVIKAKGLKCVKIGTSDEPEQRLHDLQVGCPTKLSIMITMMGELVDERWLQRRLKLLQIHSEWFVQTPQLTKFIEKLISDKVLYNLNLQTPFQWKGIFEKIFGSEKVEKKNKTSDETRLQYNQEVLSLTSPLSPDLLSFRKLCDTLPKHPSTAIIIKWHKEGVAGIRLMAVKIGGRYFTNLDLFEKFSKTLTSIFLSAEKQTQEISKFKELIQGELNNQNLAT